MKKLMLALFCFSLSAAFLAGCSSEGEAFEEKSFEAEASQVQALQIEVTDRKIEIQPSEDGNVHIGYQESDKNFYHIELTDGKTLVMTSGENKSWTDFIGTKPSRENRTITLKIPEAALASLSIATSNEDIFLPAMSFSETVSVRLNNGNIQVEGLTVGKGLDLETKNGDISGTVTGTYDDFSILSEARKGGCNLPASKEEGEKALTAFANNGDINLQFVKGA